MALIQCPDCGRPVSENAQVCPVCGSPIAAARNFGKIRVKLTMYPGVGGMQKVEITSNGQLIWKGRAGQIAEFDMYSPAEVEVKYKINAMYFGGRCKGVIDPARGNRYVVYVRRGFPMKSVLTFQMVDAIDAE